MRSLLVGRSALPIVYASPALVLSCMGDGVVAVSRVVGAELGAVRCSLQVMCSVIKVGR